MLVAASIPLVVVVDSAALACPVAFVKTLSVVAGGHPTRTRIGRPGPVSIVPLVAIAHRIPVAGDPKELRARSAGLHHHRARRRRGADSDANGYLRKNRPRGHE